MLSGKGGPQYAKCVSPIVIDTDGTGFGITDAEHGVQFDFYGDGRPVRIAWTKPGSANGWLCLPNKLGIVESGRQLFGDITP